MSMLYFTFVLAISVLIKNTCCFDIAVCISGQVGRWQPHFFFKDFIDVNVQDNFFLFFNMQTSNEKNQVVHSTGSQFLVTKMAYMTHDQISTHLHEFIKTRRNNSNFLNITYHTLPEQDHYLQNYSQYGDRFQQRNMRLGSRIAVNIHRMYYLQVKCAEQILQYESDHSSKFDYIISTREDIFFFQPMKISNRLPKIRQNTSISKPHNSGGCDLLLKDCLNFGGFNMRLQIFNRQSGITMLLNRLNFFKTMNEKKKKCDNPEGFEKLEAKHYNFIFCPQSVSVFPVTAVRHVANDSFCFYNFELKDCYVETRDHLQFDRLMCEDIERNQTIH